MPWPLHLVSFHQFFYRLERSKCAAGVMSVGAVPHEAVTPDSALKCFNDLFYPTFRSLHLHFSHNPLESISSPFDQTTCSLMEGAKMPAAV